MEQEQYEDLQAKEALVDAIDKVTDKAEEVSETNAKTISMMTKLTDKFSKLMSSLSVGVATAKTKTTARATAIKDAVLGKNAATAAISQSDKHDNVAEALRKINVNTALIATNLAKLSARIDAIYKNLDDNKGHKQDAAFLTSALRLMEFVSDEKNAKKFKKNASMFATGAELMIKPVDTLLKAYKDIDASDKAIDSVIKLFDRLGEAMDKSGKNLMRIVGSTVVMIATIALIDWGMLGKFVVMFPTICTAMAAGLFILASVNKRAGKKGALTTIKELAMGIAMLTVSLLTFNYVSWDRVLLGVTAITALSAGLALTMNLLPSKKIRAFSKNMLMMAAGVALMAVAVVSISYIVNNIPWGQLLKGAGFMLLAAGVLFIASKLMVKGADDIGKSFAWIALGLAAFGLSLIVFQELIADVKWETFAIAATSLLGLAGVAWLMGQNKMTWTGIAAIAAMVGALAAIPFIVKLYEDISWSDLGKPAAVITALSGALYVAGMNSKGALLGAAALGAGSASLIVLAMALKLWPRDMSWEDLGKIGTVVGGLLAALYGAGAGSSMTLLGAAALAAGAASLIIFALALQKWPRDISWEDLGKLGAVVGGLLVALYAAGAGSAMTLLGAAALAAGAASLLILANAFVKYPWKLQQKDYTNLAFGIMKVAGAIALIGNPITYVPLMAGIAAAVPLGFAMVSLSKGLALAAKVDVRKAAGSATAIIKWAKDTIKILADVSIIDAAKAGFGLLPFKQLGAALASLALAVNLMANGTWNEYDKNGKVIAVHNIGPKQYAAFGVAVQQLVNAITVPLQKFGAGGGFLTDSDAEKGMNALKDIDKIVNPMLAIANESEKVKKADYSGFALAVKKLIDGVKTPIEKIGKGSAWYKSNDFETGSKILGKLGEAIQPLLTIAKDYQKIKSTNYAHIANQIRSFVNGVSPFVIGLGSKEDDIEDGVDALEELADIKKPMLDLLYVGQAYAKFTVEQQKAMGNTMHTILSGVQSYIAEDFKMPQNSKIAYNLERVKKVFDGLDSPNLRMIVETAKAIDSIANANLSHVAEAKSEVAKLLFKRLDHMTAQLAMINKNTKPNDNQQKVRLNKETGRLEYSFGNDGYEADFATIAMQLDELISLVRTQNGNTMLGTTNTFGSSRFQIGLTTVTTPTPNTQTQ